MRECVDGSGGVCGWEWGSVWMVVGECVTGSGGRGLGVGECVTGSEGVCGREWGSV